MSCWSAPLAQPCSSLGCIVRCIVGCMASSSTMPGARRRSLRWRTEAMGHAPPPHGASPRPMPASHPHRHRPCRERRGLAVLRARASRASARGEEAGAKSAQHAVPHGALTALARCSCGGIARLVPSPLATHFRFSRLCARSVTLPAATATRLARPTRSMWTDAGGHSPTCPWPCPPHHRSPLLCWWCCRERGLARVRRRRRCTACSGARAGGSVSEHASGHASGCACRV